MNGRIERICGAASRPALLVVCGLIILITAGCSRGFYRRRADQEVYSLVEAGSTDPRWPLENFTIDPDRRSRMFDPNDPDCPPIPPDDPTSHQLMHCVDCKKGWPCWGRCGATSSVENPAWKTYLPYDEQGRVVLDREGVVQMALLHSPQYQRQLENLYLSALDVTFQRFRLDAQFFGGNSTFFDIDGPLSGRGSSSRTLSTSTDASVRRLFAPGSQLVLDVANSVVWQFVGADGYSAITPLSFSLVQPLLRGAGRAVVLENLTQSERSLLADIRALERFRREFYIQTVAGGGRGAAGFLGLLLEQVQIRNQQRNVSAVRGSLRQLELAFRLDPTGRTRADSVELARQRLYSSQSRLVAIRTAYETSLDAYKIALGLPPDLDLRIEDPLLERFNLIDPTMTALQDTVDAVREQLADPKQPMPADHRARTAAIRQECKAKAEMVRKDLQLLLEALPRRREVLRELSARKEFRQGDVDPALASVDALHERVVTLHLDYYGAKDPYVDQLASELLTAPDQQDWFQALKKDRQTAGVVGVVVELRAALAAIEAFEQDPAAATAAANAQLREGETPKTPKDVLADLFTRLWRRLIELSVVQARARLDAITLVPVGLTPQKALETARENRRDWMNTRAALVDQWRQIEVVANNLKSDLDLTFSGDLTNNSGPLLSRNNTTGQMRVGLQFDAPLTRLSERNAYRRALISYQQARRSYYTFEDSVTQSLRSLLRTIRLAQLDFEISRGSVGVAIMRVDLSRRGLEAPPGTAAAQRGIASTRELVDSLDALLVEQNNFASAWVDYEVERMTLDLDLGTMQLDARGMWIDPGPIVETDASEPDAPEKLPAPEGLPAEGLQLPEVLGPDGPLLDQPELPDTSDIVPSLTALFEAPPKPETGSGH